MESLSRFLICLLFFMMTSCSQLAKKTTVPEATNSKAVLNFAHAAYVTGCVEAHHRFGIKKIYFDCVKKATSYIKEMESIVKE